MTWTTTDKERALAIVASQRAAGRMLESHELLERALGRIADLELDAARGAQVPGMIAEVMRLRAQVAGLREENDHFRAAILEDDPAEAIDDADAAAGRRRAARRRVR